MNAKKRLEKAVFLTYLAINMFHAAEAAEAAGLPSRNIFSDDSFWYKEIPADVTLHENSAGFVTSLPRIL